MSKALVGEKIKGNYRYVYCYNNGEYIRDLLKKDYSNIIKLRQLIKKGDISSLHSTPNSSIFYENTLYKKCTLKMIPNTGVDYIYMYENGVWYFYKTSPTNASFFSIENCEAIE